MKNIFIVLILILSGYFIEAQDIQDLTFGTDDTFEVITWNIEWFPKNGQTTANYVSDIIEALDADVFAIQEINDTVLFRQMIEGVDGFKSYIHSGYFAGLGYIYKENAIEIIDIYRIYDTQPYWKVFPRSPLVMELTFKSEKFIVINNHFKCCGDGYLDEGNANDEENRRFAASNLLKEYIDDNFFNERVVVVGDLNDVLTDYNSNNVFNNFLNDTGNYLFADLEIAEGNNSNWSYPGWPSHLDHILITNDLFNEFEAAGSDIQTIKIDNYLSGGWNEYDTNVSDHRPVALKIKPDLASDIKASKNEIVHFSAYPNPFSSTTILFRSTLDTNSKIEIFNSSGKSVFSGTFKTNDLNVVWNAGNCKEGVYFAKLISENNTCAIIKLVLIK